jgi:hypothetical protein
MANIKLEITGISEYVLLILNAFKYYAGEQMKLIVRNKGDSFDFEFPEKGLDNDKEFAENIIKSYIRSIVRMHKMHEENERIRTETAEITPATHNIPDGIVE